jgi:hypothetical protein
VEVVDTEEVSVVVVVVDTEEVVEVVDTEEVSVMTVYIGAEYRCRTTLSVGWRGAAVYHP